MKERVSGRRQIKKDGNCLTGGLLTGENNRERFVLASGRLVTGDFAARVQLRESRDDWHVAKVGVEQAINSLARWRV